MSKKDLRSALSGMPIKGHESMIELRNVDRWISTGIPALDYAIGNGLPVGFVVELLGGKKSGKTTLCLFLTKQIMAMGNNSGVVINVQNEGDVKKSRAVALGVDWDGLIIEEFDDLGISFDYIESKLNEIIKLRQSGDEEAIAIMLDSLTLATNDMLVGKEYGSRDQGRSAALVKEFGGKCRLKIHRGQVVFFVVNQLRVSREMYVKKFNKYYAGAGGLPQEFLNGCRLIMIKDREWKAKPGETSKGFTTKILVTDNKVGKPGGEVVIDYSYKDGVIPHSATFYALLKSGKLANVPENKGSGYYFEKKVTPFTIGNLWKDKAIRPGIIKDLKEFYS